MSASQDWRAGSAGDHWWQTAPSLFLSMRRSVETPQAYCTAATVPADDAYRARCAAPGGAAPPEAPRGSHGAHLIRELTAAEEDFPPAGHWPV
ncbi:hypothetical protein [Streptomyces sp. NPDC057284]|uniref:hypothetical protein n=1 Tax=Streptomyces sp. NPDC057284 TaxID=3346083 RepID=UPI003643A462